MEEGIISALLADTRTLFSIVPIMCTVPLVNGVDVLKFSSSWGFLGMWIRKKYPLICERDRDLER